MSHLVMTKHLVICDDFRFFGCITASYYINKTSEPQKENKQSVNAHL